MGIGPAAAIPVAVKSAGLELADVDLFEINEVLGALLYYCGLLVQVSINHKAYKLEILDSA